MPKLSIADELNIFDYQSYDDIPAAKKAWITIKAREQGMDPLMVHAGIKAKMARISKGNIGAIKNYSTKQAENKVKTTRQKNMYKLSAKQWNPFVGCNFDCVYCKSSFQRQAKRQMHNCIDCYNYKPHTHENRLYNSLPNTNNGEFIFTCSNGDISFCPTSFLKKIIKRIEEQPYRRFLIQSKNPKTFNRVVFPDNVILGVTIETNRDELKISKAPKYSQRFKEFKKIKHSLKMITIEPVLEFDLDIMVKWVKQIKPIMVWLGFDSKNNKLPEPNIDEFNKLYRALKKEGFNVILKTVREK